jgi:N-(2-amino-2-carboxyethyl)-L-glutamate synthase
MVQDRFILLGHSSPLGTYPAPVVPVGQFNGALVAIYASDAAQEIVTTSESCSFISHSGELNKSLAAFDYRLHRLFALDENHILHYPIDAETEFFLRLLQDPSFSSSNPFLRLSLAKATKNVNAIESELRYCVHVIAKDTPNFLETWLKGERQVLEDLNVENLTSILGRVEKLATDYGDSDTKSTSTSMESEYVNPPIPASGRAGFLKTNPLELETEVHRTRASQTVKKESRLWVNDDILGLSGDTPIVRLNRVFGTIPFRLYAKLEMLNPTGSAKDRPANRIIMNAIETGVIGPNTVVVETSSGNMGISLAQVCSYFGLRFICVVDPLITQANIRLLEAYGAEIEVISEPDPATGEFLPARISRVTDLLKRIENCFWPNQYENTLHSIAQYETMNEIVTSLDGDLDFLFCAVSSDNTLRGYAEYSRAQDLKTQIIAVEALGSVAVGLFGLRRVKRLVPGHGATLGSRLYQEKFADYVIQVTDLDCVVGCHRLLRNESLLVGGSSGAVLMAVEQMIPRIPENASCAMIFHDRGERYLDTIYSDAWVRQHFGDVAYLWEEHQAEAPSLNKVTPDSGIKK